MTTWLRVGDRERADGVFSLMPLNNHQIMAPSQDIYGLLDFHGFLPAQLPGTDYLMRLSLFLLTSSPFQGIHPHVPLLLGFLCPVSNTWKCSDLEKLKTQSPIHLQSDPTYIPCHTKHRHAGFTLEFSL